MSDVPPLPVVDLARALRQARSLLVRICACGHYKSDHHDLSHGGQQCLGPMPIAETCLCRVFTPAPLEVRERPDVAP